MEFTSLLLSHGDGREDLHSTPNMGGPVWFRAGSVAIGLSSNDRTWEGKWVGRVSVWKR